MPRKIPFQCSRFNVHCLDFPLSTDQPKRHYGLWKKILSQDADTNIMTQKKIFLLDKLDPSPDEDLFEGNLLKGESAVSKWDALTVG